MNHHLLRLLLLMAFVLPLRAQEYTRVLVPVAATDVNGAYGLRWVTQLSIFNGTADNLTVLPPEAPCAFTCPEKPFRPQATTQYYLWGAGRYNGEPRGLLLYIPAEDAPEVGFSLRVAELSRGTLDDYVEVPVIRETAMLSTVRLLDVLNVRAHDDIPYRLALRIYALPEAVAPEVDVNIRALNGAMLSTHRLALTTYAPEGGLQVYPPQLAWSGFEAALPQNPFIQRVTVEILPVTPGVRLWAFITQTRNDTQRVSLVTPQ